MRKSVWLILCGLVPWMAWAGGAAAPSEGMARRLTSTNAPTEKELGTSSDRLRARGIQAISSWTASSGEAQYLDGLYATAHESALNLPPGPDHGFQDRSIEDLLCQTLAEWVATNSESAWAPAVRLNLGRCAELRCNYSAAITNYATIWSQLRGLTDPVSVPMAREATSRLAKLLALTGRMAEFDTLIADAPPLVGGTVDLHRAKELRRWAQKYPKEAYKCGLYCLDQIGRLTSAPGTYLPKNVLETESSANGFAVADLIQLGAAAGLSIQAGMVTDFTSLPLPCVVHLNCEHFVVVQKRVGRFYSVWDPMARGPKILTPAELAADASGCVFAAQSTLAGQGAVGLVSSGSAAGYRGRCHGPTPDDHDDPNPDPCSSSAPPGSCPGNCPTNNSCPCNGMANWFVSESYMNLWLKDTPLSYRSALGPAVELTLMHSDRIPGSDISGSQNQGAALGSAPMCFWDCSFLSYIEMEGSGAVADAQMSAGGRGTFDFTSGTNSVVSYVNNRWVEQQIVSGVTNALVMYHPDGSVDTYGVCNTANLGGTPSYAVYFVSSSADATGNATTYSYDGNFNLTRVTAADGTYFNLSYTNATATNLITGVSASYGSSVSLLYTNTYYGQYIYQITDTAGLASQIRIGVDGGNLAYLQTLTTPYGTTSFTNNDNLDGPNGFGMFDRAEGITLPDGSMEFYAQLNQYSGSDWPDFAGGVIPSGTPTGTLDSGTTMRQERNTFFWNTQQFSSYTNQDLLTYTFTWADFKKARVRHWLAMTSPYYCHWSTLASEQDPSPDGGTTEGQITWYDYAGKPGGVTYEDGTQVLPTDVAQVMPDGTTWYKTFTRNSNGLPTQEIEKWVKGGTTFYRTNTWSYGPNNIDQVEHIGPLGEMVESNWFNAYHQVVTNYDALGEMTTYIYDGTSHLLTSVTTPAGLTTTNLYFTNHRLQESEDLAISAIRQYTWNSDGTVATYSDELGMTVTNFWDGLHRLTGRAYPDGTTTTNLYTVPSGTYPKSTGGTVILDRTSTKDRLGNWTEFVFDSRRRKVAETNASGISTVYEYCVCGALTGVERGANTSLAETTTYTLDDEPRLTQVTFADGSYKAYTLDLLGRTTVVTDSMGSSTNTYDNLGRLLTVSNAFGQVQSMVYDPGDNVTNTVDANGVSVGTTYDLLHRPLLRHYPDGGVEGFAYNSKGLQTYTNQLGNTTWYTLDVALRKTAETNANAEVTQFSYDAAGDLLTLTDPKSNVTTWHYDIYRRATNKVDATSTTIIGYSYDADNRLTNRWLKASGNTGYSYDPVGNLTNIAYPSQTVRFQYDALSRRTNMVDAVGTTTWTWLAGDLMGGETGPFSSDAITYAYNNRLRSSLVLAQPTSSWTNQYTYDAAGRLSTLTSPSGTFTYDYKGSGQLFTNLALPTTSYISNTFDSVGRFTGTYLTTSAGSVLNSHGYTYNSASQRAQQTRTDASTVAYTFDPIGQLKTAKGSGGQSTENLGYLYDHAWNLSELTNSGVASAFAVNSDNELTSALGWGCNYDYNGNITASQGTITYGYDQENRLAAVTNSSTWATTFVYDGLGRLRKRQEYYWLGSGWTSANQTNYVYDGNLVLQMRQSTTPVETFTRGSDLSGSRQGAGGIGGLLARTTGYSGGNWSTHHYYHADGNGNITYLELTNQTLAASYRYDPYGNVFASSGTVAAANLYRFSSKELHAASGMYYYGYRFYQPEFQRWINRDPIHEAGGRNLFVFNRNQPLRFGDAFGLTTYVYPPENTPPGTYGPSTSSANDGSDAVVFVPPLNDSQGLGSGDGDMLLLVPELIPGAPAIGKALGALGDFLGNAARDALDKLGLGNPGPPLKCAIRAPTAGGPCFAARTKVSTPCGEVDIEDVKSGDTVYAYDLNEGKVVQETVERVHRNFTYHWVEVNLGGEKILATKSHPFWVEGDKGWCKAVDLKPGMELRLLSGQTVKVGSVKVDDLDSPETTYNFEVANQHDYFVGKFGVLVHNGPGFIVSPNGTIFPIPDGATPGPLPSGKPGIWYGDGAGGNGLNSNVTDFSIRDGNAGQGTITRASYYNDSGQKVNPFTGKPISNADPMAHIPCN